MNKTSVILACLLIALLEGFAGLAIEIYAIRISATYIGSSTSITGVILAMVLTAIAVGYWYGGLLSKSAKTPRQALLKAGFVLSASAVCHAIASVFQLPLLNLMTLLIESPIISAIGVGLIYGVGVALGSTSIPLITQFLTLHYENNDEVSAGSNAGMMVAVTTIGSVLGSTITPILLLPYIGLMSSIALFVSSLALSAVICTLLATKVSKDVQGHEPEPKSEVFKAISLSLFAVVLTIGFAMTNKIDTGIQTPVAAWFIEHSEFEGKPVVTISENPNRSISSCWFLDTKENCTWYGYKVIEAAAASQPEKLIFLGGAGMAIPSEIANKRPDTDITVIDIDKALPAIVEEHFLDAPIAPNITFVGEDARGYLNRNSDIKYDFMFIDAFQGKFVAGNLYTVEALTKFKNSSTQIMANVIGRTDKNHGYTQILLNNWLRVFGSNAYVVTQEVTNDIQNLILCNFMCEDSIKLSDTNYLAMNSQFHTDDIPKLDRYYYRSF